MQSREETDQTLSDELEYNTICRTSYKLKKCWF